jgi:hypothetical protein
MIRTGQRADAPQELTLVQNFVQVLKPAAEAATERGSRER